MDDNQSGIPRLRRAEESVPAIWKVGDVILNQYEVIGKLGEGGMGVVYKVYERLRTIPLAAKSPRPEIFTTPGGKENFIREAKTWVSLDSHPHIVSCDHIRTLGGIPRIFAEYVEGRSLAEWIRRGRLYEGGRTLALERMLDVAIQFAWGLHAAHEQGLVHQDIKPANVLVTVGGIAKVTDFGLAKARAMAGEPRIAGAGQSILVSSGGMTPAYCSPEQAAHQRLSRKTDIWSWGVSVLEMFVGNVTWKAGVVARGALASHHGQNAAIPVMPTEVVKLLSRCFELQPEKRPATMLEVATELQVIYARLVGHPYPREAPKPTEIRVTTLNKRAISLAELGRGEEALAVSEQAIRLDPTGARFYIGKALVLEKLGRLEEALAVYEQAIRLDPTDAVVHNAKAFLLYELGRDEEALAARKPARPLAPTNAWIYNNKGIALASLWQLDPTDAAAHYAKGDALFQFEQLEEVLVAYEQAIRLDPTAAVAHYAKGHVLFQLGRLEEALVAYEQAIRLDPTAAVAHYAKGLVFHERGPQEEALAAFEQAIRLDPMHAEAHHHKGLVLYERGWDEQALAAFEQAIRLAPTDADAHHHKGHVLVQLGRDEEALDAYEQAIRLAPTDADAHYAKGLLLVRLGRLEEALAASKQAIRLAPTADVAHLYKGLVLEKLGRLEEALAAFEQAIRLDPIRTEAYHHKGLVLYERGWDEEALAAFEQAIRFDPMHAEAHHHKGLVLVRLGRLEEAKQAYQKEQELRGRGRTFWQKTASKDNA